MEKLDLKSSQHLIWFKFSGKMNLNPPDKLQSLILQESEEQSLSLIAARK